MKKRNQMIRYHGKNCKWWHFLPNERYPALKSKFDDIMAGQAEGSHFMGYIAALNYKLKLCL